MQDTYRLSGVLAIPRKPSFITEGASKLAPLSYVKYFFSCGALRHVEAAFCLMVCRGIEKHQESLHKYPAPGTPPHADKCAAFSCWMSRTRERPTRQMQKHISEKSQILWDNYPRHLLRFMSMLTDGLECPIFW